MDLSEFYPSPNDLIKSELSVLNYLGDNTYITREHPQVARDARASYSSNRQSRLGFQFHSHFDARHAGIPKRQVVGGRRGTPQLKPNMRLIVSALIELRNKTFTNVSYCLSVCRIQSASPSVRLTILRKFHFDVAVGSEVVQRRRQPHPQCHLQYCGKMVPYMTSIGCRQAQLDQMHPWLSEPRIFFRPMSLALLIDMALHEFPNQDSAKFRADSYWRSLVRRQEALVLQPFYKKCVEIIKDTGGRQRTLADEFYVE